MIFRNQIIPLSDQPLAPLYPNRVGHPEMRRQIIFEFL